MLLIEYDFESIHKSWISLPLHHTHPNFKRRLAPQRAVRGVVPASVGPGLCRVKAPPSRESTNASKELSVRVLPGLLLRRVAAVLDGMTEGWVRRARPGWLNL